MRMLQSSLPITATPIQHNGADETEQQGQERAQGKERSETEICGKETRRHFQKSTEETLARKARRRAENQIEQKGCEQEEEARLHRG